METPFKLLNLEEDVEFPEPFRIFYTFLGILKKKN